MKNENQFVRVFYSIEVGRKNKTFYLIYNKCNIDRICYIIILKFIIKR